MNKLSKVLKRMDLVALGMIPGVSSIARFVSNAMIEDEKRVQEALLYAKMLGISYEDLLKQFQSFPGDWQEFKLLILSQQSKEPDI